MPSGTNLEAAATSVAFEPCVDPFRHTDVEEGEDEGLDGRYRQLALEIFGETPEKMEELVQELKRELSERGFVVPDKRAFHVKLLRAGNLSVSGAIEVLNNYISHLLEHPRYMNRARASQVADLCSMLVHTVMPQRDRHGRRVYIFRPGRWDPDKFTFTDCYALGYMMSELMALEPKTQVAGVTVVSDASGFGFKQFKSFTFEDARKSARFIQDSFPLWFRTINIVNAPRFFHLAFNLIKPMLTKDVQDSVVFHQSLESLHLDVDPEVLPEELGGTAGPFNNDDSREAMEKMEEILTEIRSYRIEKKT